VASLWLDVRGKAAVPYTYRWPSMANLSCAFARSYLVFAEQNKVLPAELLLISMAGIARSVSSKNGAIRPSPPLDLLTLCNGVISKSCSVDVRKFCQKEGLSTPFRRNCLPSEAIPQLPLRRLPWKGRHTVK
jgi:hypothetical protein